MREGLIANVGGIDAFSRTYCANLRNGTCASLSVSSDLDILSDICRKHKGQRRDAMCEACHIESRSKQNKRVRF